MEVKKIWRIQFMAGWIVLALLLMGGGFLLALGNATTGVILIVAGLMIEMLCSVLMFRNYRCPKCGTPLNRRATRPMPGVITCPHCSAGIREV